MKEGQFSPEDAENFSAQGHSSESSTVIEEAQEETPGVQLSKETFTEAIKKREVFHLGMLESRSELSKLLNFEKVRNPEVRKAMQDLEVFYKNNDENGTAIIQQSLENLHHLKETSKMNGADKQAVDNILKTFTSLHDRFLYNRDSYRELNKAITDYQGPFPNPHSKE